MEEEHEIAARTLLLATGAQYRRLPLDELPDSEGIERVLRSRAPKAQLCGVNGSAWSPEGTGLAQAAV
ncbi:MAG: hypothetical protein ABR569_07280 [Gaiellaceae bacterium]